MLIILSVIYTTYFTAKRSATACTANIASVRRARSLLTSLSRQIRCTYPAPATTGRPIAVPTLLAPDPTDSDAPVLSLITTSPAYRDTRAPTGLFELTYRYLRSERKLFVQQRHYNPTPTNAQDPADWLCIAENLHSIDLAFFDGNIWHKTWDSTNGRILPAAARIDLTFTRPTGSLDEFSTVIDITCSKPNTVTNETIAQKL